MTPSTRPSLQASDGPLTTLYDVALLDLDGVVYVGPDAVPGVPASLAAARTNGMRLAFVTNNAARPPHVVAEHLTTLGVPAEPAEVTTSSQAAAHYLADLLPAGSAVLVVGTTGLIEALRERGLTPVFTADDEPAAVVQGYSPDLGWQQMAEATVAIRRGVPWVATNLDPTVPSPRGPLPGNGALIAAVRTATGKDPVSTGKPDPTMHRESVQRAGAERPIVVGDRLDTDIEGASAVGCASLLVLSGVTDARDLVRAEPRHRPTYLAHTTEGLLRRHPQVTHDGPVVRCGRWSVTEHGGELLVAGGPEGSVGSEGSDGPEGSVGSGGSDGSVRSLGSVTASDDDGLDVLRALCVAAWDRADSTTGGPHGTTGVVAVRGTSDEARRALHDLGW